MEKLINLITVKSDKEYPMLTLVGQYRCITYDKGLALSSLPSPLCHGRQRDNVLTRPYQKAVR
jgi:hypothetical protein